MATKTTKKKPAKKTSKKPRPVLVTTAHRGVFFGYATDTSGETVVLERARNCLYWHESVRGFIGLAANGPNSQCRIGPACSRIELRNITSVSDVSADAVRAWESAPW